MCACADRRAAFLAAASALRNGNTGAAMAEFRFVATSSVADAKAAVQAATRMAARSRLAR